MNNANMNNLEQVEVSL